MEQVEVALHDTVLARSAVDGDIGIVEDHRLAVAHKREVVFVYLDGFVVFQCHVPVLVFHVYDIDVVTLFVEK